MARTLPDALRDIRVAAERHMDSRARSGLPWSEEAVTEVAIHVGAPLVREIPFNRGQEAVIGADWLWVFTDGSRRLPVLVQAKRIKHATVRGTSRWSLDASHDQGAQHAALLEAGRLLEVPTFYTLYAGGRVFDPRPPRLRSADHSRCRRAGCRSCRAMAVCLVRAGLLDPASGVAASRANFDVLLSRGFPLEFLAQSRGRLDPSTCGAALSVGPLTLDMVATLLFSWSGGDDPATADQLVAERDHWLEHGQPRGPVVRRLVTAATGDDGDADAAVGDLLGALANLRARLAGLVVITTDR